MALRKQKARNTVIVAHDLGRGRFAGAFRDLQVPGIGRIRIMSRDVFSRAMAAANDVLRKAVAPAPDKQ